MSRCKSCDAEIVWAKTDGGKNMPLDAKPEKRAIIITRDENLKPTVRIVDTYRPHWASCPHADQHRKPRRAS